MSPTDPDTARRLLAESEALLLDFDGPVCSVFAGLPAQVVVDQLCVVLADGGYGDPPPDIEKSSDPFDVLKYAVTLGEEEARFVNAAFTAYEVEAIATAEPTPGAFDFIYAWFRTGRPLAIVSNNSSLSIETYLDRHELRQYVTDVCGRTSPTITVLKPDPYLLDHALAALHATAEAATFIGDSTTDIKAARAAHTRSIGYANKPEKAMKLRAAGADVVVTSMSALVKSANYP